MDESPVITFYTNDSDAVITSTSDSSSGYIQQVETRTIYADAELTNNIGTLTTIKQVYNLDSNDNVTPNTVALYKYAAAWNVPDVKGISVFTINLGNKIVIIDKTIEAPDGVYLGGAFLNESSGDFRNYGGSVMVEKSNGVSEFKLQYSLVNVYNTSFTNE